MRILRFRFFRGRGYDGSLVGPAMQVWRGPENRMTPVWENGVHVAEIVRCQIGRRYDGSEVRNSSDTF